MSQQVQQQPFNVYPYDPVIKSQPDSSQSIGSYTKPFIILAAIFIVAVACCVLNRFCSQHGSKKADHKVDQPPPPKPADNAKEEKKPESGFKKPEAKEEKPEAGPKKPETKEEKPTIALRERADIESGFDRRFAYSHGGGGPVPCQYNGGWGPVLPQYSGGWGPVPPHFGSGRRPEARFADNV